MHNGTDYTNDYNEYYEYFKSHRYPEMECSEVNEINKDDVYFDEIMKKVVRITPKMIFYKILKEEIEYEYHDDNNYKSNKHVAFYDINNTFDTIHKERKHDQYYKMINDECVRSSYIY